MAKLQDALTKGCVQAFPSERHAAYA